MGLEQKLNLKLSQRLVMTPSLQQAIKLLQLSRLDLSETLSEEILENPMLLVDTEAEEGDSKTKEMEIDTLAPESPVALKENEESPEEVDPYQEIDVEAFFADYLGDSRIAGPSMAFSLDDTTPSLENTLSAPPGLYDHLLWQLHMSNNPARLLELCEFIIGNLDEDGLLRASDDEILKASGCNQEELEAARKIILEMDPPGVGTRNLQECLIVQLDHLNVGISDGGEGEVIALCRQILSEYWDDFLHQRWKRLAEALNCELGDLQRVLEIIQRLEPKPGRIYQKTGNSYIEPDVFVRRVGDEFVVSLNDDGMPKLRINPGYARMLEGSGVDPKLGNYLREKMKSALWLRRSVEQRQATIRKVAESIVAHQKQFLEHGIEYLRPMILRQVAEDIGMHESTVSRVVSNKYMYTPRGLIPMKFFFHSGVDSARGSEISSLVVKERIRRLIDGEDSHKPYSDSRIMKTLQREGIRLARRTVAKYREEIGIPSSDKRKNVFK